MATPSNVNKTINDENITPDAKRVKLFSGPDGEKMDSINESQQPQPENLDTQSLILCSSDGQSFDLTTVIKNAILNPECFSMMSTLLTQSIESSIKTAISEATVGLHKKIETQEKEISDLKAESSQIKIENRRLNDNVFDLMVDIEELEQYGRRNSLRFHNVPITKEELNKTDDKIVDICKQHLKIDITPDDINRSHIIGKIHHEGSCQLICRFRNWKIKNQIFKQKKQLKSNANKIYITEDLTRYRQQLVSKIQIARKERRIDSFWTNDGRIFLKKTSNSPKVMIKCVEDIYSTINN